MNYKTTPLEQYQEWFQDMQFKTEPFYHQYASLAFALGERINHVMFLHGIGTGKTLTALYLLQCWNPQQKTLIISPNSVINTWIEQIEKHTDFSYVILDGTAQERIDKLQLKRNLYIINYEGLRTIFATKKGKHYIPDKDTIQKYGFEAMIADECHRFKDHTALQSKIARLISQRIRYSILMTGTPISRSAKDLFGQYQVLDNGHCLGNDSFTFLKTYFYKSPFEYDWQPKKVCHICGEMFYKKHEHLKKHNIGLKEYREKYGNDKTSEQLIMNLIEPVTFQYTREECLDLPEQVFETRSIQPTTEQLGAMEKVLLGISLKDLTPKHIEYHTHKILQIVSGFLMTQGEVVYTFPTNPKLDELSELINEMEGKYIIYHQYIYESVMIGELLKQKKIQYVMLNGEITDKGNQIEQFQNNDNCRCLIAHPKSGGEGLNLQCANTEIFFNNGFIGTILRNQAEGRIHRTGQKKNCLYIDLIMEGTVDQILYNSLKNNEDYVKNLLEYFHCRTKS